jgi:hypothetical protein
MGLSKRGTLPPDLRRARDRFQAWRERRQAGERIPPSLWTMATRLAGTHGVSRTATALGLDYYSLKQRVEAAGSELQPNGPAFVEVSPTSLAAAKHCRLEFDNGGRARLRMELSGYDAADLEALARGFGNTR